MRSTTKTPSVTDGIGSGEGAAAPGRCRPSAFARFASTVATVSGRPATFAIACIVILVWAVSGPIFGWSDTWQLVINTATTIVTFLMVFVIQNAQNRDGLAIQVKLDELIRATRDARDGLVGIEHRDETEVERLEKTIEAAARAARRGGDRNGGR